VLHILLDLIILLLFCEEYKLCRSSLRSVKLTYHLYKAPIPRIPEYMAPLPHSSSRGSAETQCHFTFRSHRRGQIVCLLFCSTYVARTDWQAQYYVHRRQQAYFHLCLLNWIVSCKCLNRLSQLPCSLRHEMFLPFKALGLWFEILFEARMFVSMSSVFAFSCVRSGLATGWSPVQGVLSIVYETHNSKLILTGNGPEGLIWK
jgi:hypothetical protein